LRKEQKDEKKCFIRWNI